MEYEWDEVKRLTNLRKHGIDFSDVPSVFEGDTVKVARYSLVLTPESSERCHQHLF
jgi:hypothetical protein